MDKLLVKGPAKLEGQVSVSCAKNAYLPILAAVILVQGEVRLKDLPELRDIQTMLKLLENLGVKVEREGEWTVFDSREIQSFKATYDLVKTMRASIFVLGPLLARMGEAMVSLPGGCAIGTRPIDLHLKNLEKLGVDINLESGYVHAKVNDQMRPGKVTLDFPSVGATENLMMAAVFGRGETIIENAAKEPEVEDLGNFLNAAGAKISGHGTSRIHIEGVDQLKSVEYRAIADRIEAGTYVMAALATQSHVTVKDVQPAHLDFVLNKLIDMGAQLKIDENQIEVFPSKLKGIKIETAPYPGFPTDLQAQMIALTCLVDGSSIVSEHIFENRFMHVPELIRMGGKIDLEGHTAVIQGQKRLSAAPVMCTDLRASAALVIAALASRGETEIQRVYHLDRGYEKLEKKFEALGAQIKRIS